MMAQRQQKNHEDFTATFPSETTQKWEVMVENWNVNRKLPNPYIKPIAGK